MKIRPIFCSCLRHQVTPLAWSKIQVQKNNGLLLMVMSWNIYNIQYVPPLVQEELPPKNQCSSVEKSKIIITLCSLYCSSSCKEKAVKNKPTTAARTCASVHIQPPNQHEPYPWFTFQFAPLTQMLRKKRPMQ